jgi:SAM-dependent methyltransferase
VTPATRYDAHVDWYETFRPSLNEDEVDVLRRFLGSGPGRCLDLGCGSGVAIPELERLGWTVTGIDLSEEMLGRARCRAPHAELRRSRIDLDAHRHRRLSGTRV